MTPIHLLAELERRGVELRADGDRLRYRPREAVTPELIEALRLHKAEVLVLLTSPGPPPGLTLPRPEVDADPRGVAADRALWRRLSPRMRSTIEAIAEGFASLGDVELLHVTDASHAVPRSVTRRHIAQLLHQARRTGNRGLAVAMRDSWRERLAVCVVEGGLDLAAAERVAAAEVAEILDQ